MAGMPGVEDDGSTLKRTPAIGLPGSQTFDPTTGLPMYYDLEGGVRGTDYQGPMPSVPYSVGLGYADPMNRTAGATGLTATGYAPQQPRYFDGDQYSPINLKLEERIQLQDDMFAAGLYEGTYTRGVWEDVDFAAYERLLALSNRTGVEDKAMLQQLHLNPLKKKGSTRAPLVIKLTNPMDLKKTLQQVSRDLYGGNLPDEDQERFVQAYQSLETGASQAAYAAGEAGGTFTDAPDPGVFAEQQIRETRPLEVRNQGFVNNLDQVLSTFMKRLPGGGAT